MDSAYEDDELVCPLCIEEMDVSDRNFRPCPCGYQVCQFCWNHIRTNLNGNCPACRRPYSEQTAEFKVITSEEYKQDKERAQRQKREQKLKEKERKDWEQTSRKHLQNIRVVQKNLVYVIGLNPRTSGDELLPILKSSEFFGQYGKIQKIVISKHKAVHVNGTQGIGVYVTYYSKEDAAKAIEAIDGSGNEGRTLRASYGTTKYCTSYLKNQVCSNPTCMYLHEPGDDVDSFTREDLSTFHHAAKTGQKKSVDEESPAPLPFVSPWKKISTKPIEQPQKHTSIDPFERTLSGLKTGGFHFTFSSAIMASQEFQDAKAMPPMFACPNLFELV
jgi:hypothetical protein